MCQASFLSFEDKDIRALLKYEVIIQKYELVYFLEEVTSTSTLI